MEPMQERDQLIRSIANILCECNLETVNQKLARSFLSENLEAEVRDIIQGIWLAWEYGKIAELTGQH